jgi:hypothetical protein
VTDYQREENQVNYIRQLKVGEKLQVLSFMVRLPNKATKTNTTLHVQYIFRRGQLLLYTTDIPDPSDVCQSVFGFGQPDVGECCRLWRRGGVTKKTTIDRAVSSTDR